ncbi:endogenous retrovirus group K member 6 Pro protein-like [Tamandua tetradactyla]|uniref:endogenous retrovirus group K member 6 Pro protein-like n=1 Tax=Tamandua tetradactyla TaxID=48850 RepID=UPI0040541BFF
MWTVPITPNKPTRTLKIDKCWYTGTLDSGAEISCLSAHLMTRWEVKEGPSIIRATGSAPSLRSTLPLKWEDDEGHSGTFQPLFLTTINQILWGRDILTAAGASITTQPPPIPPCTNTRDPCTGSPRSASPLA